MQEWDENPVDLALSVYNYYLGETKIREEKAEELTQMLSDRHFKVCNEETAHLHTVHNAPLGHKVFKYELQHRGQKSLADFYNSTLENTWVSHGDDIQYLFDMLPDILQPLEHPADLRVRDIMLTLWINFAATGNPTPDGSLGFKWWPTSESHQQYLALTTSPTMKDDNPVQHMEFWKSLPTKNSKLLYPKRFLNKKTYLNAGYYV
ncbi:venom carboxylesterase-6-like [Panulirus ornatus]|uniref:venom carboxylesterase-6-like n=1 Tax=Panulirus ornatus TaxID=150431 RepID=UPI003A87A051